MFLIPHRRVYRSHFSQFWEIRNRTRWEIRTKMSEMKQGLKGGMSRKLRTRVPSVSRTILCVILVRPFAYSVSCVLSCVSLCVLFSWPSGYIVNAQYSWVRSLELSQAKSWLSWLEIPGLVAKLIQQVNEVTQRLTCLWSDCVCLTCQQNWERFWCSVESETLYITKSSEQ